MFAKIKKVVHKIVNFFRKPAVKKTVKLAVMAIITAIIAEKISPTILRSIDPRPENVGFAKNGFGYGMDFRKGMLEVFDERPGKDGSLYYSTNLNSIKPLPKDAPQGLIDTVNWYARPKVDQ